ncbi:MAG TPA: ATP synthase F0 subunit C [Candidatus Krumholzibacteria bacterium]|nr:ATP synthase F0 subunit C [Candidatus Krumholzibacteria bacterium]
MDLLGLAIPLGLGIAAFGCALGLGRAISAAMDAMGRQPEAIGQIQTAMIIGCALIEALAIYSLVISFVLQGKVGA